MTDQQPRLLICTRCRKPITGGRDTYTLAPHVYPGVGPMHWPISGCKETSNGYA